MHLHGFVPRAVWSGGIRCLESVLLIHIRCRMALIYIMRQLQAEIASAEILGSCAGHLNRPAASDPTRAITSIQSAATPRAKDILLGECDYILWCHTLRATIKPARRIVRAAN